MTKKRHKSLQKEKVTRKGKVEEEVEAEVEKQVGGKVVREKTKMIRPKDMRRRNPYQTKILKQPDEKEREAEVDEVKEDKTKPKKTKPRKPAGSPFLERTKAKRALSLEVQRGTPEGTSS